MPRPPGRGPQARLALVHDQESPKAHERGVYGDRARTTARDQHADWSCSKRSASLRQSDSRQIRMAFRTTGALRNPLIPNGAARLSPWSTDSLLSIGLHGSMLAVGSVGWRVAG